jgi:hypothetical protein
VNTGHLLHRCSRCPVPDDHRSRSPDRGPGRRQRLGDRRDRDQSRRRRVLPNRSIGPTSSRSITPQPPGRAHGVAGAPRVTRRDPPTGHAAAEMGCVAGHRCGLRASGSTPVRSARPSSAADHQREGTDRRDRDPALGYERQVPALRINPRAYCRPGRPPPESATGANRRSGTATGDHPGSGPRVIVGSVRGRPRAGCCRIGGGVLGLFPHPGPA